MNSNERGSMDGLDENIRIYAAAARDDDDLDDEDADIDAMKTTMKKMRKRSSSCWRRKTTEIRDADPLLRSEPHAEEAMTETSLPARSADTSRRTGCPSSLRGTRQNHRFGPAEPDRRARRRRSRAPPAKKTRKEEHPVRRRWQESGRKKVRHQEGASQESAGEESRGQEGTGKKAPGTRGRL